MNQEDTIALEDKYAAHNYHPLPVVLGRGKGVYVWDINGKKYIDCLSGYSALNQGHRHPAIINAMKKQADQLTLTSRAFHNDQFGAFCQSLSQVTGFEQALLMNTGAEAVETAIKLARKWGYQHKGIPADQGEIIVCHNNFHGRTTGIIGFSSDHESRDGFGPFAKGFVSVPFGDAQAIAQAITPRTAAVLVEPIQGEAGVILPPDGYLKELRRICSSNNALLMLDEVQTGLGRTGAMFAYEHERIRPDVLILGKALSGGVYPVSAVCADKQHMSVFTPGTHGSTYGGNPVACAVGRAALAVLHGEQLPQQAATAGTYMLQRLQQISSRFVREVRGKGLLIGIELDVMAGGARRYCESLLQRGVLCKEAHKHVIRIAPPLIITQPQIDEIVARVEQVLTT